MKRTIFTRLVAAFCLTCLFGGAAAAQTVTGSLVGHVEDANGGVIPGVHITITDIDRGTGREAITNDEGNYTFSSLAPGVYRVEVESQSFKKFINPRAEVAINTTLRVDAKLEPGGATETVEVSGAEPLLKTDRGDLSTQITTVQIENLPLTPDRNFQSLLELVPGVTPPEASGSAFGNPGGSLSSSINGQNNRYNGYQLDGTINNQTNVTSQIAIVPPPDAIQVVDVSTNAYDAEQGRATGGVVNVQIKSGTNNFHGTLFYFNTNSALKARNTLSQLAKPTTNLTQFGFTIGGPIRRDRTFFFGDYQGGRDRRGQEGLFSVPTLDFRNGNFGASTTPIFDPATGTVSTGANRTQFAGNIIPQNRISPVARNILAMLPLPNLPGLINNYQVGTKFSQNRDSFDVKINQKFTDKTEGFARYSFFKALTSDPPAFGILGGPPSGLGGSTATAAIGPARDQSVSLNLTHTFSPTLVTEARFGLVRVFITGDSPTDPDLATQVGIPGINTGDFLTKGLPRINISGFDFLGTVATVPFKIAETSTNFVSNWTNVRGNHTIRFGTDIRNLILNPLQSRSSGPRGDLTFTTGSTSRSGISTSSSNAFASFLLGLPQTITRTTVQQEGGYRQRQYFFYAQDRWQVSPNLTLNYGLRYEVYPFAVVANPGDQSRYDPATNQLLIAGYGPINRRLNVKTQYNNFAPRLGLAYRLDNKTVIRTGYGLSYNPFSINSLNPGSFPAQPTVQVQGANSLVAAGNIANGIPPPPVIDVSSGSITPTGNLVLGVYNPNPRRGYTQSFNFTVQRDIFGFVTEVSYVGNIGTRLPGQRNINATGPRIGGARTTDRPLAALYGRTADTFIIDFMLSSSYNALQTKIERRLSRGSKLTVSYTYSKSLDYTDAFTIPNPLDDSRDRGPSAFDRRHNFVASHVIRLPGHPGRFFDEGGLRLKSIFGGFQLNGVFSARSGTPVDIIGVNLSDNRPQGFTNRPNVIAAPSILGGTGGGALYFDTAAFVEPAPGTFGNVGRNTVRGPNFYNYNLGVFRNFTLKERYRFQFRADAFNLTNTPHFNDPSGNFTNANFGRITTSFGERQIRFGLHLDF